MASSGSATRDPTEENKKFFNERAATYDNSVAHTKLMQIVGEEVLGGKEWSGVVWDENTTKMLDYACGTGLISRVLAPYTKQLIGMDTSEGMVEQFNKHVDNQGIPHDEMRAIVADLCADEVDPALSDPQYSNFDVAISTLAFHHFGNVPLAIKRLVERLKPETGVLLVIDFRTHESIHHFIHQHSSHAQEEHTHQHDHHQGKHGDPGSKLVDFKAAAHTVTHSGFSEDEIKRWYGEAGLVDVDIVDVGPGKGISMVWKDSKTGETHSVKRSVFMAKGRRA